MWLGSSVSRHTRWRAVKQSLFLLRVKLPLCACFGRGVQADPRRWLEGIVASTPPNDDAAEHLVLFGSVRDALMALTRLLPALVLASAATAAQSVPPVGLRANIVELVAVALDDQGTPVVGLQDSDFEIEEDGRLMPISTFAAKNADATASPADGRVVVLWLDDTVP